MRPWLGPAEKSPPGRQAKTSAHHLLPTAGGRRSRRGDQRVVWRAQWVARARLVLSRGVCSGEARLVLSRGVLARAFQRMRAAGAGGTHSLASPIVFSLFCFVSFEFISFVIIMSVHHGHGGNVGVGCMHGVCARWARLARTTRCRAVAMLVRVLSMPSRGRPTASQWPVTRAPQKRILTCKRVLPVCEHVRWW